MGFVQCKKRQERRVDQKICMVCDEVCEEKSNLEGIRIAKNEKLMLRLIGIGGRDGKRLSLSKPNTKSN
jgi:hypothetical protein